MVLPIFKEGRAYCFASVHLSVGWSWTVSIHFLWRGCTYWNRFITVISRPSLILGTLSNCWQIYAPWTWKHSFYLQFPCIFAAEVTYTGKNLVYRFIIMIYVFRSSSIFGKIKQLLVELCPLDLKKFTIICSYRSFSLQKSPREGAKVFHTSCNL